MLGLRPLAAFALLMPLLTAGCAAQYTDTVTRSVSPGGTATATLSYDLLINEQVTDSVLFVYFTVSPTRFSDDEEAVGGILAAIGDGSDVSSEEVLFPDRTVTTGGGQVARLNELAGCAVGEVCSRTHEVTFTSIEDLGADVSFWAQIEVREGDATFQDITFLD